MDTTRHTDSTTAQGDGLVVWLTGLPASGKSTLARRLRDILWESRISSIVLDGDELRDALVPRPGYSDQERANFYESLGNIAGLLAQQGQVVLVPATANRRLYRARARGRAPRFVEVYVCTPAQECSERDLKGLYEDAEAGHLATFPGIGADYEAPLTPDVKATGGHDDAALAQLVEHISLLVAS